MTRYGRLYQHERTPLVTAKSKRERCGHVHDYKWMRHMIIDGRTHAVTYRGCEDCGAWLSLGPSNDERCRHDNADHMMPGEGWALMDGTEMPDASVEQLRCLDCGAWLSLGPSNDEPAEVKVEMRAAEMVQDIERIGATVLNRASFEAYGMNLFHNEPNETAPANAGEQAGYLAAAIVGHEEGGS